METINGIDKELIMNILPKGNIGTQLAEKVNQQQNNQNTTITPIENSTQRQETPNQPITPIENTTQSQKTPNQPITPIENTTQSQKTQEEIRETLNGIRNPLGTATEIAIQNAEKVKDKLEEEQNEKGEQGQLETKEQVAYDQEKLWEREDQIRKETQEREDNAFQRMISDMRKAGINPNLVNISGSGASSGGGITSATPKENIQGALISKALQESLKEIELAFEKGENTKDRITQIYETLSRTIGSVLTVGFLSMK